VELVLWRNDEKILNVCEIEYEIFDLCAVGKVFIF